MKTEKNAISHFALNPVERVGVGEIGATDECVCARTEDTSDGSVTAVALIGNAPTGKFVACNHWVCTQQTLLDAIIDYLNA